MKKVFVYSLFILFIFGSNAQINVQFDINTKLDRKKISPLIYGNNYSKKSRLNTGENYAFTRIGGNRATAYNWETNASNAGSDWHHQSDNFWCNELKVDNCDAPASVFTAIIDDANAHNIPTLITVPMVDFVAADKSGVVGVDNPKSRWNKLLVKKPTALSLVPDTTDKVVYSDEFINFMLTKYGKGKLKFALDNEPDLWSHTHERIYPNKITCKDLMARTVAYSKMIKSIDPQSEVFGFVSYGFNGFYSLQGAPDWEKLKANYDWFIDYFLDQTKKASDKEGKRLVDVLDLHWYPEAKGDKRVIQSTANSRADKIARLQSPRSLWDSEYVENSWIAESHPEFLPLLPAVQKSIDKYYPETKIAFTEFQFGGYEDITGTITLADVFGIFGKYGIYASNHWGVPGSFGSAAYKLFRNYNAKNAGFGDISVQAATTDKENSSVYASVSDEANGSLHIISLNKNMDSAINATFNIPAGHNYNYVEVYYISADSPEIKRKGSFGIRTNSFNFKLPALTAFHFVLKK